jgi:hypothetical protein
MYSVRAANERRKLVQCKKNDDERYDTGRDKTRREEGGIRYGVRNKG